MNFALNNKLIFGLFFVLAFIVYHNAAYHEFIAYDDQVYLKSLINNDAGFWSLVKYSFSNIVNSNWHPLTMVSLVIDYEIYGVNAGGYHVTNLILHIFNAFIVYLIFSKLSDDRIKGIFVALIFLVHPINVEVVAWIAERKGVLGAFFALLSINAFVNYRQTGKRKELLITILSFAAALMAKAVFVTLPVLFVILDIYFGTINNIDLKLKDLFKYIKTQIPLFIIALTFGLITIYAHTQSGALGAAEYVPWGMRIAKAIASIPVYLMQFFYPVDLAIPYPYKVPDIALTVFSIIVLCGSTFLAIVLRQKTPYLFLGWFWYLILLFPVSGILQSGFHAHADRYAYIPLIGIIYICAAFVSNVTARYRFKGYVAIASFLLVGFLMLSSLIQFSYWRNSFSLFYNTYSIDNDNFMANTLLSGLYIQAEQYEEGMRYYRQARNSEPTYLQLYDKISDAFILKNQSELAVSVLTDSLKAYSFLSQSYGSKYNNLKLKNLKKIAKLQINQGNYQEAGLVLDVAANMSPDDIELNYLYGHLYLQTARYELAETYLNKFLQNNPDHYLANYLLIRACIEQEKHETARLKLNQAIKKFPDNENELSKLLKLLK